MKNTLIAASFLALAISSASAFEVGVQVGRDFAGDNRNYGGVTVGQNVGPVSVSAGYQRTAVGDNNQNRWSLVGGYDLLKVSSVQITPTVGVAYLNNQTGSNGLAMTFGAEVSMPITKNLEGVVDYTYQMGQSRVNQYNGGRVGAGVRFNF
jgi:hypothetical protein